MKKDKLKYVSKNEESIFVFVQALNRCIYELNQSSNKKKYSFDDFKHDYYSQIIVSDKFLRKVYLSAKSERKGVPIKHI